MRVPVKLMICYVVAVVAIFLVVNVWGTDIIEDRTLENVKQEYYADARMIADEYVLDYYNSEIGLSEMLRQMRHIDSIIDARIWLVNSKRVVVADTRQADTIGRIFLDDVDKDFLNYTFKENVSYSGIFKEPVLSVTEPVMYDFAVRGYVCLHVPMTVVEEQTVSYMNVINLGLLSVSGILLGIFAVIYIITVYPITRIRRAALEYAKGNYSYSFVQRSHDEYRDLTDALQYMVGEIRNVDDYQKKFIANISHDFRSPLTSIKGYAEAIKDGTIPYEAQNRYLDIILFETDRLTKLTTNLLELNRMDSKGLMLDITSFDINAVIKKTAATFEGICTQKRIRLNLEFMSKETYVEADMGRIQQVLYNLTDNAIKFSESDSQVIIETEEKGSKVLIRVKDFGAGIPKESIKKIWDRFYKSDYSRGKDKKGTGLGLSIVKEIITAHDENINVISTEGVGTEFTFMLPLSEL